MVSGINKIPFVDLIRQYKSIKKEIDEAISRVLQNGSFIQGENVKEFEQEFAAYVGSKYSMGVGSGTDALRFALEALDISQGDEVLTVSHTFVATVYAIIQTGATPILVDIDPETYTINTELIERAITTRTKVIIPVHLYGQPADMASIMEIAERHNLWVVEDAAQANGAEFAKRRVGAFGHVGCFSFYPTKNLGAYGDGGMITTNEEGVAEKVRMLREYGQRAKYHHAMLGYNSRLDEMQAAILRVKLKYLDSWNERRRKNAELYDELLGDLPNFISLPVVAEGRKHVYHLYVVRAKQREALREFLSQNEVATGVHYPIPVHQQPAYINLMKNPVTLPVTERISQEVLSLPMFPELTADEVQNVCFLMSEFLKTNGCCSKRHGF